MKKLVLAVMMITLLVSTFTLAFSIHLVKAIGTIYIRADGSVDPPTAPLVTLDNVTYTLTANVTCDADGIVVVRDNIILDGACYTLQGPRTFLSRGIGLSGRTNVTVRNTHIKDFYAGVGVSSSINNRVSGNHITANGVGVLLDSSSANTVSGNHITGNGDYGVRLFGSTNNTISGNNMTANDGGVCLVSSSANNTISGNSIMANYWNGVWLDSSSANNTVSGNNVMNNDGGVYLISSSANTVSDNHIANNAYGVVLDSSFTNTVTDNNIIANGYGVFLTASSSNRFYHNNVIDNSQQVGGISSGPGYANLWDDGYPKSGNYWSDYTGEDLRNGVNQDRDGSDGIGDTPYDIDAENQDRYPLMKPWVLKTSKGPGDVNGDGEVDIYDAVLGLIAYGSRQGDPNWNPSVDLAPPLGIINIYDLVTITSHYGKTYP